MSTRPSIIERAFQLASSGRCADVKAIRDTLSREQYASVDSYIRGTALLVQLRRLITTANAPAGAQEMQAAAEASAR